MDRQTLFRILRNAVLLFLPLAAIVVLAMGLLYYDRAQSNRAVFQVTQEKAVELGQGAFTRQLAELAADVQYLAEENTLQRWLANETPDNLRDLQLEYLAFARNKSQYDQVRFIDLSGEEVLRADHERDGASLTPADALQDKADRPYFENGMKLSAGETYFSRFDLNVEQGRIEQPIKPMIRVAAPVYDAEGVNRGLVVLNYAGQQILTRVKVLGARAGTDAWLVDEQGYWMLGPSRDDEWTFMYPSRADRTFADSFPTAWQRMTDAPEGSFADDGSLFAYTTIVADAGNGEPTRKWYLISHASAAALPAAFTGQFLLGGAVVLALLAVISLIVAANRVRREQVRAEIDLLNRRLAHSEKMEALGQLTGGVAHDFNNILAVILGSAEVIREEVDDEELKSMAELITQEVDKGSVLTERLLAIGRRQALHPVPLDLGDFLTSLWPTLLSALGGGISAVSTVKSDQVIMVDQSHFESAVINIALNARAAMPEGGVFTVSSEIVPASECLVRDPTASRYARISFRDTGVGMSPETAERAFDPFFTTNQFGKSAGVGLAVVYGFAHRSHGYAAIESEPGVGTTIHLYLPLAEAAALARSGEATGYAATPESLIGGTEKVLVVEDEPYLRAQVSRMLAQLGYSVTEAETGVHALDVLAETPEGFDILFTDIVMPGGVSGIDLVQYARGMRPNLRVLLTTGYANASAHDIHAIGEPILNKPYRKQQLAEAMRNALRHAA